MILENSIQEKHSKFINNIPNENNSVHNIVNRILFCSSSLVYNMEELFDKYGIDIPMFKNITRKNSPYIVELVKLTDVLGLYIDTEKSPYVNFHLDPAQLQEKTTQKKIQLKKLITKYGEKYHKTINDFINLHNLDNNLINSALTPQSLENNEFEKILKLITFFNIQLEFNNF